MRSAHSLRLGVAGALCLVAAGVLLWMNRNNGRGESDVTRDEFMELRALLWEAREGGEDDPRREVENALRESMGISNASKIAPFMDLFLAYQGRAAMYRNLPLMERLEALRRLRREMFGEAKAEELFGEEERMAEYYLRRSDLLKDPNLSVEERAAREEALRRDIFGDRIEEELPTDWFRYYEEASKEIRMNSDLSDSEREAVLRGTREGLFGKDAANRLEQVEEMQVERAEREKVLWKKLDTIQQDASLTDDQKAKRASELRGDLTDDEWRRFMLRYQLHESSLPPSD